MKAKRRATERSEQLKRRKRKWLRADLVPPLIYREWEENGKLMLLKKWNFLLAEISF